MLAHERAIPFGQTDAKGAFRFEQVEFEPYARESLLQGLDDIALTLKREEQITDFERSHPARVDTSALPV